MTYFNVNYNSLKNYIMNQKEKMDSTAIMCLFDMGIINRQQYEDLMTIIAKPFYDYKQFYQENKGYYHAQGPLTLDQNIKSIVASRLTKKLIKK